MANESRLIGMNDLLAKLNALTFVQGQQVLAKSLRRGGQLLAEEVERNAPHDTGRLAANIKLIVTDRSAVECTARVGPTRKAFYASMLAWGTKYITGDNWVQRAWNSVIDKVQAVIRFDLSQFIDKAIKKNNINNG